MSPHASGASRTATSQPRLILADDHHMVVEAFKSALGSEFIITGTADNGEALLDLLKRTAADCLLLDLEMPGRNGLALIPTIRRLRSAMKIIIVTMADDRVFAEASRSAGAHGFVPKSAPIAELKAAIGEVLSGRCFVSARVMRASHRVGMAAEHLYLNRLTARQQEIVMLVGEGKSLMEIAHQLCLAPSTITFHKHNVMRALGIRHDGEFVRYAVLLRAGCDGAARG